MEQLLRLQNYSMAELGVNMVRATPRLVAKPPACLAPDKLQGYSFTRQKSVFKSEGILLGLEGNPKSSYKISKSSSNSSFNVCNNPVK